MSDCDGQIGERMPKAALQTLSYDIEHQFLLESRRQLVGRYLKAMIAAQITGQTALSSDLGKITGAAATLRQSILAAAFRGDLLA
jgi:hypothetical protein